MANDYEKRDNNSYYVDHGSEGTNITRDNDGFFEETAAEIAEPYRAADRSNDQDNDRSDGNVNEGRGIGYIALALSIISLFVLPVLLGAAGIIVGYIARRRGAWPPWSLGNGYRCRFISAWNIYYSIFLTQKSLTGSRQAFCVSSFNFAFSASSFA